MPSAQQQQQNKPRDGPATVFEADPKVVDIFTCRDGEYFGLVLVANWPPEPTIMEGPYQNEFLKLVRGCFGNEQDWESQQDGTLPAAVYLYPTMHLHVTIATFAPPEKKTTTHNSNTGIADYDDFQASCLSLVQAASKLPDWPTKPIQLVVDSTQLGTKAGIILWKDVSGSIDTIRSCLQQAEKAITSTAASNPKQRKLIYNIPGIIHSTFLRFSKVPKSDGDIVQQRYQANVVPFVHKFFDKPIIAKQIKLVCESTPYMHIPDDDNHVLLKISLE